MRTAQPVVTGFLRHGPWGGDGVGLVARGSIYQQVGKSPCTHLCTPQVSGEIALPSSWEEDLVHPLGVQRYLHTL